MFSLFYSFFLYFFPLETHFLTSSSFLSPSFFFFMHSSFPFVSLPLTHPAPSFSPSISSCWPPLPRYRSQPKQTPQVTLPPLLPVAPFPLPLLASLYLTSSLPRPGKAKALLSITMPVPSPLPLLSRPLVSALGQASRSAFARCWEVGVAH